jgi:16S rRNA (guanine1207-N2)-methyltransferase
VQADDEVLDIGCGCGVIGIAAAAWGARRVEMVDTNLLAVASVLRSLSRLSLPQAHAYPGDALSESGGEKFSLIVSNPPFHSGKGVDYSHAHTFIRQGRQALHPGGRMVVVANHFIRYERLMAEQFRRVETLAADSRFHVLCGLT